MDEGPEWLSHNLGYRVPQQRCPCRGNETEHAIGGECIDDVMAVLDYQAELFFALTERFFYILAPGDIDKEEENGRTGLELDRGCFHNNRSPESVL